MLLEERYKFLAIILFSDKLKLSAIAYTSAAIPETVISEANAKTFPWIIALSSIVKLLAKTKRSPLISPETLTV